MVVEEVREANEKQQQTHWLLKKLVRVMKIAAATAVNRNG